jgi:hypothetical protein
MRMRPRANASFMQAPMCKHLACANSRIAEAKAPLKNRYVEELDGALTEIQSAQHVGQTRAT